MRFNICLAAIAATVALASPAAAQTSASAQAEARGLVLQPLTLTRVDDLDFGTVLASATAGSVTINENTGSRSVAGGVTAVATGPGQRALFTGAGTPGQQVSLSMTTPTFLISGPNAIAVTSMSLDAGGATTRTIGATGTFDVGVGGVFAIAANQPNGLYTASFDLTAQYP
ncbi:DUF4402 domain-containing protein [Sphingomonas xanthus]|uniref:DUF4402 domain-containing protein n=1 Tax=Sphingomonas xanthus TaxID=2594473 RepID=A0A516IRJ1_9SPHN|nr:DUF4402 domain-containing protein [Sphingomonas xanthus]QDP19508.1 DUF4402 domain-containing protein [Sphingomonas xanthus]